MNKITELENKIAILTKERDEYIIKNKELSDKIKMLVNAKEEGKKADEIAQIMNNCFLSVKEEAGCLLCEFIRPIVGTEMHSEKYGTVVCCDIAFAHISEDGINPDNTKFISQRTKKPVCNYGIRVQEYVPINIYNSLMNPRVYDSYEYAKNMAMKQELKPGLYRIANRVFEDAYKNVDDCFRNYFKIK